MIDTIGWNQSKNGYDYLRLVKIVSDVGNDLRIAILSMNSQLLPMIHNELGTT